MEYRVVLNFITLAHPEKVTFAQEINLRKQHNLGIIFTTVKDGHLI